MNFLRENILSVIRTVEEYIDLGQLYQKYSTYLFYFLSILSGYILGILSKKNPMNQYLNYFRSQMKSQQQVENKISFLTNLNQLINWTLLFNPIIIGFSIYILNTEVLLSGEDRGQMIRDLAQRPHNKTLLLISFFCFFGLLFLKKVFSLVIQSLVNKKKLLNENKQVYIQKFFNFIGEEMKLEIKQFLLDHEDEDLQNEKLFKEKLAQLQESLRQNEKELKKFKYLNQVSKNFIDQINSFEWCNVCYQPERDTKHLQEAETPQQHLSEQISSNTTREDLKFCKSNCLQNYLIYCEEIGEDYYKQLHFDIK